MGDLDGRGEGDDVGLVDGTADDGFVDGPELGLTEGLVVGLAEGRTEGTEGTKEGVALGSPEGGSLGRVDGSDVGLALLGDVVGDALDGMALEGSALGVDGWTEDGRAVVGINVGDDGSEVGSIVGLDVGGKGSHCLFAST